MTRKRFKKLLMSKGYTKKEISKWVERASDRVSYDDLYRSISSTPGFVARQFGIVVRRLKKELAIACKPTVDVARRLFND